MNTSKKSSQARPDPETRTKLWFSKHPAPARHAHLSTGEPVGLALLDRVKAGIAEAIKALKPNHPYKAKYFVEDWDDLSHGNRRRAGRCIADFARRPGSPIGLIRRGKGQSHRYFIRPVTHQAPSKQHPNHHQP